MKKLLLILLPFFVLLVMLGGCATTPVTFSEGTPKHESINTALQSNGLDMRLVSIIDEGATDSYKGMTLTSYALSETEVTQGDYGILAGPPETPYDFYNFGSGDTYPAFFVSWHEAAQFCNALSTMCGLEEVYDESTWEGDFTKNGFYLPTEAQWEYAAGGANHYKWSLGNTFNASDYVFDDRQTRPVGSHPANGFGLYDMTGSVLEWCHDWYGEAYPHTGVTDPSGPARGTLRMARGGYHRDSDPLNFKCEWRGDASDPTIGAHYGIRVAAGGHGNWQ